MALNPAFHRWHWVSLVLAMVAGASLAANWLQVTQSAQEVSLTPDVPAPVDVNTPKSSSSAALVPAQAAASTEAVPLQILNELDDLRMDMEATRDQLADLQRQVVQLSDGSQTAQRAGFGDVDSSASLPTNENADFGGGGFGGNQTSVKDALRLAGIPDDTASLIQRQQDQQTLNRLELLDRAAREGWAETDRLDEELENLEASSQDLREQLGDDAYDRYLYHAGRPNRVVVASVIQGSVADQAGLQAGDSVISYGSNRLFTMQDLRNSTQQGVRNEPVVLEVMRGGQSLTLDAVRGPLGVTMTVDREEP
jgi:hypothetical protein